MQGRCWHKMAFSFDRSLIEAKQPHLCQTWGMRCLLRGADALRVC